MKIKLKYLAYILNGFFLMMTMTTVYHVNNSEKSSLIASIVLLLSLIFSFINKRKIHWETYQIVQVFVYLIIAVIFYLLRNNGYASCINVLFCAIPGYLIYWLYLDERGEKKVFLQSFIVVVSIMACISIFCWIFITRLQVIEPTDTVYLHWGRGGTIYTYHNIYFLPQRGRNCAIFAEGPAANYVFFSALLLNEFYVEYKKRVVNVILIIAIITTLTTTGQIGLVLYLVCKLWGMKKSNMFMFIIKNAVLILAAISALLVLNTLFADKLQSASGNIRFIYILREWSDFLQHPLLGWGFCSHTEGSSNSITALLADGGIVLWAIYYFPIIGLVLYDFFSYRKINFLALLYLTVFAVSVFHYTMLSAMITTLLWQAFLKKVFQKKRKGAKSNNSYEGQNIEGYSYL